MKAMFSRKRKSFKEIAFEESLSDNLAPRAEMVEVPLTNRAMFGLWFFVLISGAFVGAKIFLIGVHARDYAELARINLVEQREIPAPRGLMYDRYGEVLAENEASFYLFLDTREFFKDPVLEEKAMYAIEETLGIKRQEIWEMIGKADLSQRGGKVLISDSLDQRALIALKGLDLPAFYFESGFRRAYPKGPVFSSVVGYTGLVNVNDLERDETLSNQSVVGRGGLESFYDKKIRGTSGSVAQFRNAKGELLGEPETKEPEIGKSIRLTIDGDFQTYFFDRFRQGLASLGRSVGVGLAMNPKTGEVLALFNFPAFDNNLFSSVGRNEEKKELLASSERPLFNRAVAGFYNPGSTIKPLIGIAALKEGVITPEKKIFSPGYLDLPNPYDPEKPTRFLDWRYQGWVDVSDAIAQSSNVYFYTVGGGFGDVRGLGISRIIDWFKKFNLGTPLGIDLPTEGEGLLPDPEKREKTSGRPWLLGDTYNVSIGQGDFLVTPLQLLNYINAIANGGKIYRPFVEKDSNRPAVLQDLSYLKREIGEVKEGMAQAVRSPLGTASILSDLPFDVAGKTGSAQVRNNTQENAFFVGYAPVENPQISILVLIENSREGSLNAVPIAKDALNWYYWNRIKTSK